jgi:hypothetical protein
LDESPANQSRQKIFGRLIFQSPEIATLDVALPVLRDAKLLINADVCRKSILAGA